MNYFKDFKASYQRLHSHPKLKNYAQKSAITAKNILLFIIMFVTLIGITYIILSPLIGMVSTSFMSLEDAYNPLVYLIPTKPTFSNYKMAFNSMGYTKAVAFTLMFSLAMTAIQIAVCSVVGYGFARFKFPLSNILFAGVILTIIVPIQTLTVPLYTNFRFFNFFGLFSGGGINLMNTYAPMIMMTITGMGLRAGLYIYIFRQFFKGLPKEIEEASLIDGAGVFKTFFTVMLPNAMPSIITVALFSMVWQYNDVYYSGMFMAKFKFISLQISTLGSTAAEVFKIKDPNQVKLIVDSGIVLTILPIVIIYLIGQKFFIEGMERSGIVG